MLKLNVNKRKGFLLVELLVALFIFSIVATVSIGSIVSIIDANRKNQSLKSVMNNLNLAVDSITRYASVGYGYNGYDGSPVGKFSFISPYDLNGNPDCEEDDDDCIEADMVTFEFEEDEEDKGYISRTIEGGESIRITAPEIDIDAVNFYVIGEDDDDTQQPKVFLLISGSTVAGPRLPATEFKIQTVISQRLPDIQGLGL